MKLRRFLFAALILNHLLSIHCSAQGGEWTWVKGDSIPNSTGYAGTITVPSALNEPAARYAGGYWTDTAGNFWIYSGVNAAADLWEFNPETTIWTWMQGDDSTLDPNQYYNLNSADSIGVYNPGNTPGQLGYGMLTWTTPDNHLWLFGGLMDVTSDAQQGLEINDNLWQYDPSVNEWAWMGTFGPAVWGVRGVGTKQTMPGGRQEGNAAWVDSSGNLWFFGGADVNLNSYDDMWEYNVRTRIWTWMSGSDKTNDIGQYGAIGKASVNYYPSARLTNLFWKDSTGNFWLSGGTNYMDDLFYQDTWMFNPGTLEWTWVNGPEGEDSSVFGVNCILDSANQEGEHYENRSSWKECNDLIISYNGFSDWNTASYTIPTNVMWVYKISTNEWVKINEWDSIGRYGTQGVSSPRNYPKSRFGGEGFVAKDGSLWMFGGQYDDVTVTIQQANYFNDLWKYVPDSTCVSCARSCNITTPVVSIHDDTLFSTGSADYQWYFNNDTIQGATAATYAVKDTGSYFVEVTNAAGCKAISNAVPVTVIVSSVSNLTTNENVSIYPNPSAGSWQLSVDDNLIGSTLEVYDEEGRIIFHSEINNQKSEITATALPAGVYYLRISSANVSVVKKLVKL